MNFLAPIFLAGAAAVVLPVLFHLVRQSARRRTLFSSLMFLKPALPRLTRRNKIDHLLLLVLRGLIVVLLATAFARPFVRKAVVVPFAGTPVKRSVVLLDTSASMQREGLWGAACRHVEAAAQSAGANDDLALCTFDEGIVSRMSFEEWRRTPVQNRPGLVRERLAGLKPCWAATRLDRALIRAIEMLELEGADAGRASAREVVLVSDFVEGSVLDELAGYNWPKDVRLVAHRITPRNSWNVGIHLSADTVSSGARKAEVTKVRVIHAGMGGLGQVEIGWADANGRFMSAPIPVAVAEGRERVISVPAAGAGSKAERLVIRGDADEYDNVVYVAGQERETTRVVGIGRVTEGSGVGPLYFLERAFAAAPRLAVELKVFGPEAQIESDWIGEAGLVVVTCGVEAGVAELLRERVMRGGTAIFVPLDAGVAGALREFPGCERVVMEESRFEPYGLVTEIDTGHPLFAPFADARFSDFTKVRFWKYRRIDPQTVPTGRVIASFDNGDAAIIDVAVGSGRVLIFAAGWHPADSQLALSSKFVPMMHAALELSAGSAPENRWRVGQPVPVRQLVRSNDGPLNIVKPDGRTVQLGDGESIFSETDLPGIYTVTGVKREIRFAVNMDAAESRTTPMQLDELERLGARLADTDRPSAVASVNEVRQRDADAESRQGLWRWFIAAALMIVFVESVLAGRAARAVVDRTAQVQL
jgi:hypothetical protein